MSTTPKKPPAAPGGTGSTPNTARKAPAPATTNGSTPSRSQSSVAIHNITTSTSGTGAATTAVNRTRSVRNGAPVSARAAARKPATPDITDDDDAKAELQAKLDELQDKLNQTESSLASSSRHAEVLQIKLDEALKEQTMLEDSVHEHTERIEELAHERKEQERGRREMEQIYEAERVAAMREKEEAMAREEDMQISMLRLKEALQQREIRAGVGMEDGGVERSHRMSLSRMSSYRSSNNASPNLEASGTTSPETGRRQFAPTSLQRSDSRSSSRLVMEKDKIIESLRLELADAQIKLIELENRGGGHVQLLEKGMYELKIQNARLMEENESFQLLLSEKTLNGGFTAATPADVLREASNQGSRPPTGRQSGISLADELDGQDDSASVETPAEGSVLDTKERRLQSEVNSLKDQNKALTLYINNIISRLLQHEQFEQILDKTPDLMAGPGAASMRYAAMMDMDKELPPPPPPKDEKPAPPTEEQQAQGLLARAGSVLRGRGARPPRPMSRVVQPVDLASQQQPRVEEPTLHENPQTAPQVPLARSRSSRGAGHKRANSDWPAASVVTNMYKGPPASTQTGPMSPGLGSPTGGGRNSPFFPLGAGHRVPSGASVPTISEIEISKENRPPSQNRDSKLSSEPHSNRSSVMSNPTDRPIDLEVPGAGEFSSNPSSPPRSTASSGDKDSRTRSGGGAIMMGGKPRPLRLVQEAQDDEKAKKAANRGSWFGWMNKGAGTATQSGSGLGGNMPSFMQGRSYSGSEQGQGGQ